jgi:hypothetical protein
MGKCFLGDDVCMRHVGNAAHCKDCLHVVNWVKISSSPCESQTCTTKLLRFKRGGNGATLQLGNTYVSFF